jgi:hypothetical protein
MDRLRVGSFADGQATMRPQPLVQGRYSTGQEREDRHSRPVSPTAVPASERRVELETAEKR